MDLNRRKFCLRRRFESKFYAKHTVFAWKILAQILLQSKNIRCLLTFIKGHDIIHFVDAKSTTYAGVAELADAIDLGCVIIVYFCGWYILAIFGKTISLFLIEGDPNKRWVCELSNWNGKAYKIPRIEVKHCSDRNDLAACGIYFLFGRNDTDDKGIVYIGEAENVFERLKQHDSQKDFWNECIVFISKDNRLNKAHIKYLEYCCYMLAKNANRYTINNSQVPAYASLTEPEQAEMDEFLYNIRMISNVLGHKVLEPFVKMISEFSEDVPQILYITTNRGANAKGMQTSEGFVVLKDSQIADGVTDSCPKSIRKLREQLTQSGIINENRIFTEDKVFSSPSTAASVVMGRSANGRTEWRESKT